MKKRVNGVWQTDPYMLYEENEFDVASFPVSFYSKGGNIPNWSVVGNSVQASTPTPTNPVEIAQFGDLITSGVNAGKYDISITSAGQTKHIISAEPLRKIGTYVDTVDSDGAVTRRTGQYIITDGLSVSSYTSGASGIGFSFEMNTMMRNARRIGICTHFEPQTSPSGSTLDGVTFGVNNFRIYFTFSAQTATSLNLTNINDVRAWIDDQYANGTPVTVYYVLETPTTEVIHDAPELPTNVGVNTLDFETTLKPSRFTADLGKMFVPHTEKKRVNGAWI